jgi:hypothetical protein
MPSRIPFSPGEKLLDSVYSKGGRVRQGGQVESTALASFEDASTMDAGLKHEIRGSNSERKIHPINKIERGKP